MARRIGFYTLRKLAQQMCKYVVQFEPAILIVFPPADHPALHVALEGALTACAILDAEIAKVETPGV